MKWYPRHLGDFKTATAHLSMLKTGAFDLLLDHYYAKEQPLPSDEEDLRRICSAFVQTEIDAMRSVLAEFFFLGPDGKWHNEKADFEIAHKKKVSKSRSEAGHASVTARRGRRNGPAAETEREQMFEQMLEQNAEQTGQQNAGNSQPQYIEEEGVARTRPSTPQRRRQPVMPLGPDDVGYNATQKCFVNLSADQIILWAAAYPDIDCQREVYAAAAWLDANPERHPGDSDYKRFLVGWMSRSQREALEAKAKAQSKGNGHAKTSRHEERAITVAALTGPASPRPRTDDAGDGLVDINPMPARRSH